MLLSFLGGLEERPPQKTWWHKDVERRHVESTKRPFSCSRRPVLSCECRQTRDPHSSAVGGLLRNGAVFFCSPRATKHDQMADEMAEPYFLYGKALLEVARQEACVLGTAVPGT